MFKISSRGFALNIITKYINIDDILIFYIISTS